MNKTEVVNSISGKTGIAAETCAAVMDALEQVSGSILVSRIKGVKLHESEAVDEIAGKAGISQDQCVTILSAFEETFGEALSGKFRLFK